MLWQECCIHKIDICGFPSVLGRSAIVIPIPPERARTRLGRSDPLTPRPRTTSSPNSTRPLQKPFPSSPSRPWPRKDRDETSLRALRFITDTTGLAILDAIGTGERDPRVLASLRDDRCKKNEAKIAQALKGDWREDHVFTLSQSLEAWRFHQNLMADCDQQIAIRMNALEDRGAAPPPMTGRKGKKSQKEPMREQLCEKFGVDLTAVEGVSIQTCLAFLSEVGTDVEKFASAEHFASWMGLCPDNRIT
jgi:hypothetical protein